MDETQGLAKGAGSVLPSQGAFSMASLPLLPSFPTSVMLEQCSTVQIKDRPAGLLPVLIQKASAPH